MLDEGFMAEARGETFEQEREREKEREEEICAALVAEWKDCEELKRKPKVGWVFVEEEKGDSRARSGVHKGQKVSMHEMWKRRQV